MPAVRAASTPRYSCFLGGNRLSDKDRLSDGDLSFDAAGLRVAAGVEVQLGSTPSQRLVRDAPHRTRFLGGYPLVWVSDPVTGFAAPYWAPRGWAAALAQLRPGESGHSLPAQLAPALQAVGALIDPAACGSPDQPRANPLAGAAAHFAAFSYATVSGLAPPAQLRALGSYQRELIGSGQVRLGDAQCPRRYGMHDEPIARFFLHQLRTAVARIVGRPVVPAYTYSVTYEAGAVLAAHTDRAQCEYTLSLLVDVTGDAESEPWPLWLEADGEPVAVRQVPGDALLFAGRRLRHWRDRLPDGRTSTSLLLHYVDEEFTGSLR
ncbi:MAG: hypothetical protein QOE53_1712 [Pseudonocardiales bacterium]|jgi:hypothetical protein|nr:hypothetical protein [Pseudonocardiales bacterium]